MTERKPFDGSAHWIWSEEGCHLAPAKASPSHYEVRRFRRSFEVRAEGGCSLTVHVSGDSRYLLYVNGALAGRGPAKGDVRHHFYETFDVTPLLRPGRNTVAALVVDFSKVDTSPKHLGAPTSVMTRNGGFLLDGDLVNAAGDVLEALHTNAGWRVLVDEAYRFQNEQNLYGGFVGYFEDFRPALAPRGWLDPAFDDSAWPAATVMYPGVTLADRHETGSPYGLVERMMPPLEEGAPERFQDAFLPGGKPAPDACSGLTTCAEVTVGPGEKLHLVLDAGVLTTGYPVLEVEGGAGASVRLTYAEALRLPHDTPGARVLGDRAGLEKVAVGHMDAETGWTLDRRGAMTGWCDIVRPSGGGDTWEPLHWRTFRFVGLEVETGDAPLVIRRLEHRFTAYPYQARASFDCSEPSLKRMWDISLRTMRLCAHETFEDCPYYEQLQYAGDAAITSALGMLTSGDCDLTRQALYQFAWSLLPEGITQSRYPSRQEQVIPSWSLHWISMVRDYLMVSGDLDSARDMLPQMHQVLDWFRRHEDGSGLPARLPYWNTTDWCPEWDRGQPPGWDQGPTCVISSQYLRALEETAWVNECLGEVHAARALRNEARAVTNAVNAQFWSEREGLYLDRPGGPETSQYGNAWAVYAGAADPEKRRRLLERFPDDPCLAPASFFGTHYVFEALNLLGAFDLARPMLGPWREMADAGLTTWAEETKYWRSLCHAWSAHPALHFLGSVLGVRPVRPGFAEAVVEPHLFDLDWAEGSVCTPAGPIRVRWERNGEGLRIRVDAPGEVDVTVRAPSGETVRSENGRVDHVFGEALVRE